MSLIPPPDAPSTTALFDSLVAELLRGLRDDDVEGTGGPEDPRAHLLPFTRRLKEDYDPAWFHGAIAEELERWWATDGARTVLCVPPQHGKTELASRNLPAWILGKAPDTRIIAATYSDDRAQKDNLDVQRLIDSPPYASIFPGTRLAMASTGDWTAFRGREFARARRTAHYFEIVGRHGFLRSAGIGAGIGGMPADVLIIDDPIKDRKDAESESVRESIWSWYTSVAKRRLKPPGKVLVIMTRWHEDDLAGKLLQTAAADEKADRWEVVRFPAFAETTDEYPRHPSDLRADGEALWEARYPRPVLEAARAEMTGYEWDGLMQQRPTRPGGLVFQRSWFKSAEVRPALLPGAVRCRFWDIAATENDPKACYTVGVLLTRFADGRIFVEDVVRGQWSPDKVEHVVLLTARADGVGVLIREEREPGSSGKAVVLARARDLVGFDYRGVLADQNKVLRWRPFAAQCEAGNVYIVAGPKHQPKAWVKPFLDELERAGPGSKFKDQVDAASGAFLEIAQKPRPFSVVRKLAGF
jgi:predicted phage terminase large subunit-like protein